MDKGNSKLDQKKEEKKKSKPRRFLDNVVQIMTIAWTTAANLLVGVLLGRWLDKLIGTHPFMLLVFSLAGLVSSILNIFKMGQKK